MCGGGGGGGSGTQQYNWNDTLKPLWTQSLNQGNTLSQTPYQQYGGQRIAGFSPDQNAATNEVESINQYAANPMPTINSAMGTTNDTLGGRYLDSNPYSVENQYADPMSQPFQNVFKSGLQDITNAYNQGTAADTTRMFNLAGAFGGSAHQNAMTNNELGLGKTINNYANSMLNDQLNRSSGLEESALNRGSGNYNMERGLQQGAIGLGNEQQNLALQRAQSLMGAGDASRSYNQDILNQQYNDWQDMRNQPFKMSDWFSGLMGRAQGGVSPNMTSTQSGYSASPFSQLLGAGLMGYGLTR